MLFPSGDHSDPDTPSGASVSACGAPPLMGMAKTCGRSPANARSDRVVPSGDHRKRGAGTGVLKILMPSASLVDPTYSSPSCWFVVRFGVETTYATRSPSGEIFTSTIERSFISSASVNAARRMNEAIISRHDTAMNDLDAIIAAMYQSVCYERGGHPDWKTEEEIF